MYTKKSCMEGDKTMSSGICILNPGVMLSKLINLGTSPQPILPISEDDNNTLIHRISLRSQKVSTCQCLDKCLRYTKVLNKCKFLLV